MKKNFYDFLYNTFLLTIGSIICAVAVNGFLIPHGFLSCGVTGFALLIYYKYPIMSVGLLYLLINIPILGIGWLFVGLRFIFYTIWGMTLYSIMLYLLNFQVSISDNMLSAVIAGGLNGLGSAIMLRSSGSGGGSAILCVILNKFFSITLGTGALIINSIILMVSSQLFPIEKVLYTFIYIAVSTKITNMVFHGLANRKAALIISEEWKEILNTLTNIHKIGVTLINGHGGYYGSEKTILYSVLNRTDIQIFKKTVIEIDPNAFITIMEASDVIGVDVDNQPQW